MSKRQALLETLLGAAELSGNRLAARGIRRELVFTNKSRADVGYQRLALAAFGLRRQRAKAA